MGRSIGVVMTKDITAGLIEDHRLIGEIRRYPEDPEELHGLIDLPTDPLVEVICDLIMALKPEKEHLDAIGIALPGIVLAIGFYAAYAHPPFQLVGTPWIMIGSSIARAA